MLGLRDVNLRRALGWEQRRSLRRVSVAGGLVLGALALVGEGTAQVSPTGTPAGTGVTSGQAPSSTLGGTVPQASTPGSTPPGTAATAKVEPTVAPLAANLQQYKGLNVEAIEYEGVDFDKSDKLTSELAQKAGTPFDPEQVRAMTRRLFATGRYRNIAVRVEKTGAGVTLIFSGIARYYVGRVQVDGLLEDRLTSLVEYGTQLNPGAPFRPSMVVTATDLAKQVLAQNGFFEPVIAVKTDRDDAGQQVNVTYTIDVGPQAKVGIVRLMGKDPGVTEKEFRKKGKLKATSKVTRDTASTALSNLRSYFQKKDRLEATVSLQKSTYDPATKRVNYDFIVEQGPTVKVRVDGAKFSKSRLHLLVPVYEEGTVDIDLLNEGRFNMKDYLQQQGYFDATVNVQGGSILGATDASKPEVFTVTQPGGGVPKTPIAAPAPDAPPPVLSSKDTQTVVYTVDKGKKHKVVDVELKGNKYFSTDLLKEGLSVQKADAYLRSGRFSQKLVTADENKIQSIYRANGFSEAKVTSKIGDSEKSAGGKNLKVAQISVIFTIVEGKQQQFGAVGLKGVDSSRTKAIQGLLQAQSGQPFSLVTLSGDRDAILSYYLSNGFDQARIEVAQSVETNDKSKTNVSFNVTEGKQVFVGRVLESGIQFTKQKVVDKQVSVHNGDPLDQSALLESQRKLYDLALFNEVVAAVQNPTGDAEQKNVLLQLTEAKRWDVTYGFGFEAQTGTPGCTTCTQQGTTKAQEGKAGISPRVSADVSRINLLGTQDSLALHGTYGLLEKVATLTFSNPHLYGSNRFSFQVSGGYSNVQDITTFASSTLQGDVRVTHKATKKDTFIYNFEYRRVAVDPNSLAISSNLIPILSEPVRVAGPGVTWFHDTRSPSPLDAAKGSYTSVQEFLASSAFGSQTDFSRTDISNATYYQFGKRKYVFARNTRLGFIASYGVNPNVGSSSCVGTLLDSNASCNPVPLPERLYAGGATSHRGFPINGAGPRDLQTGFPVGGSAVLINTFELRLPAPVLPYVGDSVSFVLIHDMGNVFQHVGDMFPSIGRFKQPNEQTCRQVSGGIAFGTCDFNYFSHAVGVGARYKTPVGPIRVDLMYNLNPPVYPIIPTQNANGTYVNGATPSVGNGSHFQFFFSIGQSF